MACDGHGTLQTDAATQILVVAALSSHEFIYIGNLMSQTNATFSEMLIQLGCELYKFL